MFKSAMARMCLSSQTSPDNIYLSGTCSVSEMFWSLLTGTLALSSVYAQTAEEYIATEGPIAKAGLLANIGVAAGAKAGVVIASPSKSNPDYFYTWTRDSSLVFQAIIDQLSAFG
jgi:glucoamylase